MMRREFLAGAASFAVSPPCRKHPDMTLPDALKSMEQAMAKDASISHYEVNYNPDSPAMLVIIAFRGALTAPAEHYGDDI